MADEVPDRTEWNPLQEAGPLRLPLAVLRAGLLGSSQECASGYPQLLRVNLRRPTIRSLWCMSREKIVGGLPAYQARRIRS
jgi:hypothetical protein